MRVPLSWLKKYVSISLPPKELAHHLTMAGTEVAEVEETGSQWDRDKIVVGRVLKVDRHPNADRLTLPTVDLGDGETMTVVCGAPNVAAGQKIAFARVGALLLGPRSGKVEPLKAARIRGVLSAGMVCSALELGLGENHQGILVLDGDAPTGVPLADYLGDVVLDVEVTPNRPDCLSLLGIAHEVAALTGQVVTEPDSSYPEEGSPIENQVKIEIADPDLCHRYTASLITGVSIGPSPRWVQDALVSVGQRPINNVVDITNYVMLEYGQPLHAFDFDAVKESTIIVRVARPGEVLVTLDGERRVLKPPMLTIADAHDAVGLAGVMGGANSEVHQGTTSVLLESANFDPVNTHRTAATLQLSTEASYRFERGIRAELAPRALPRATRLIQEICGGTVARGIIDLYPGRTSPPVVKVTRQRINQVLGVDLPMARVENVLESLGFERTGDPEGVIDIVEAVETAPTPERDTTLWTSVPYWRSDVSIEDDLVEEVARIVGYDTIPTTMLSAPIPHHKPQPTRALKERIKDLLASAGMRETISYPLTSLEALERVGGLSGGLRPVKVANPMSVGLEYLRTSLRSSVLQTLASNRRLSQHEGIRLFEIGHVYIPKKEEGGTRELPEEREVLVAVMSGPRGPTSWLTPQTDMGFYDAKGVLDSMFDGIGLNARYEASSDLVLQPGRTARVECGEIAVGVVGEVHPGILEPFDMEKDTVALFEVDLEALSCVVAKEGRTYRGTSRFPEAPRDLALVVDEEIPSARVQAIIEGHSLVVRTVPFDLYSGPEIPTGKKSVGYRVVFQSESGTLTAEQVNGAQETILQRLYRELGAGLRAQ